MRNLFLLLSLMFLSGCVYNGKSDWNNNYQKSSNIIKPVISIPDNKQIFIGEANPIIRIYSIKEETKYSTSFSTGSAFVVKHKGSIFIVTAYHVVEGAISYRFLTDDRKPIRVSSDKLYLFPRTDSAVFAIVDMSIEVEPFEIEQYKINEVVKSLGYPRNGDFTEKAGEVINTKIETSVPIEVGMSGGPLLNSDHKVIGVVSLKVIGHNELKGIFSNIIDVFDDMNNINNK